MIRFSRVFFALLLFAAAVSATENFGEFLFHHISDSDHYKIFGLGKSLDLPAHIEVMGINLGITLQVMTLFVTALLLIILLSLASKRKNNAPISRLGHAIEAVILYLRDEVVVPNIGKKDASKWLPFFLTLFFFILGLNLMGMIPGMSTPTGNINFTATMAILVFLSFNIAGMVKNGPVNYFVNLVPKGIPFFVVIILAPIEVLGLMTKTFALAIRLFANITAGHTIILSLLGLIAIMKIWIIPPVSLGFSLFISLIEILVAFIQAYVFTLLSSLFIGMAIHQEH